MICGVLFPKWKHTGVHFILRGWKTKAMIPPQPLPSLLLCPPTPSIPPSPHSPLQPSSPPGLLFTAVPPTGVLGCSLAPQLCPTPLGLLWGPGYSAWEAADLQDDSSAAAPWGVVTQTRRPTVCSVWNEALMVMALSPGSRHLRENRCDFHAFIQQTK